MKILKSFDSKTSSSLSSDTFAFESTVVEKVIYLSQQTTCTHTQLHLSLYIALAFLSVLLLQLAISGHYVL